LIVGIIFKVIKDEWDIFLCKTIVCSGFVCLNATLMILLLVDESQFNKDEEKQEDKHIEDQVGSGWINKVLYGILAHKIIGMVAIIGIR